jgi:hypothetical protein
VTSLTVVARLCEGCGRELPRLGRPDRRYHDGACRARAARRRRREELDRRFAEDATEAALRKAVETATTEPKLLAQLAKASAGGSVRASIYLLERLHPREEPGARAAGPQADELAALRARIKAHRR